MRYLGMYLCASVGAIIGWIFCALLTVGSRSDVQIPHPEEKKKKGEE